MNKDGNADVIVQQRLDASGAAINRLAIFLQSETGEFRNATQTIELTPGKEDVFCNVGDFNGDACPDLLVVQVPYLTCYSFFFLCVCFHC